MSRFIRTNDYISMYESPVEDGDTIMHFLAEQPELDQMCPYMAALAVQKCINSNFRDALRFYPHTKKPTAGKDHFEGVFTRVVQQAHYKDMLLGSCFRGCCDCIESVMIKIRSQEHGEQLLRDYIGEAIDYAAMGGSDMALQKLIGTGSIESNTRALLATIRTGRAALFTTLVNRIGDDVIDDKFCDKLIDVTMSHSFGMNMIMPILMRMIVNRNIHVSPYNLTRITVVSEKDRVDLECALLTNGYRTGLPAPKTQSMMQYICQNANVAKVLFDVQNIGADAVMAKITAKMSQGPYAARFAADKKYRLEENLLVKSMSELSGNWCVKATRCSAFSDGIQEIIWHDSAVARIMLEIAAKAQLTRTLGEVFLKILRGGSTEAMKLYTECVPKEVAGDFMYTEEMTNRIGKNIPPVVPVLKLVLESYPDLEVSFDWIKSAAEKGFTNVFKYLTEEFLEPIYDDALEGLAVIACRNACIGVMDVMREVDLQRCPNCGTDIAHCRLYADDQ